MKSTTNWILVRHGECKGNVEGLFRGRIDFPLTEKGIEQTKLLAKELKDYPVRAIYTSPLSRCVKTAEAIQKFQKVDDALIFEEEALINIKLGEWEGKSKSFIRKNWPGLWKLWITEPEKLNIKGAETLEAVQKRAFKAVREIIACHKGGTIVIVSHRAVLKPLIARMLSIRVSYFWKIHMDNCAYSILEYKEKRGFTLMLSNQTKHLKEFIIEKESA